MAGLGTARQQAPAAQPEPQAGAEPATPEEQALYERFVKSAQDVLVPEGGEQVSGEILANLRGDFDPQAVQLFASAEPPLTSHPQDSVAATAVLLVLMIDAAGQAQGINYPDEVVQHAGVEVIEMLVAVAEAAGIYEFGEEELEGIYYRALDLFRTSSPRVDPEALKAGWQQIVEADRAGQLDKVLPGLPGGPALERKS